MVNILTAKMSYALHCYSVCFVHVYLMFGHMHVAVRYMKLIHMRDIIHTDWGGLPKILVTSL